MKTASKEEEAKEGQDKDEEDTGITDKANKEEDDLYGYRHPPPTNRLKHLTAESLSGPTAVHWG